MTNRLVSDDLVQTALDRWRDLIQEAPAAKANRIRAEHARKRTLSKLFLEAPGNSIREREAWAETQDDYLKACDGEAEAIHADERCRAEMNRIQAITEAWRTEQATIRANKF